MSPLISLRSPKPLRVNVATANTGMIASSLNPDCTCAMSTIITAGTWITLVARCTYRNAVPRQFESAVVIIDIAHRASDTDTQITPESLGPLPRMTATDKLRPTGCPPNATDLMGTNPEARLSSHTQCRCMAQIAARHISQAELRTPRTCSTRLLRGCSHGSSG